MKCLVCYCFVAILLPNFGRSLPLGESSESLVLVGDESTSKATTGKDAPLQLKNMHVISNIRNRYGRTIVTSQYVNPSEAAQEATFSINLPESAFISGFVMAIKDKTYEAYVREKEQAKKEYDAAVSQGIGAAHVAVDARDSNKFTVTVNVEPLSKVTFNLTYEQLLQRNHGRYEFVVNLNPGQLVKKLHVDVHINETRKIIDVESPALRSGNKIADPNQKTKNEYATIKIEDDNNVEINFAPSIEQQKLLTKQVDSNNAEDKGLAGQFVVHYDVERDPQGGEVLINDGYFVHFFSPSDLKPIPKHVVFVLDVSGSMYGRKIEQLREAMKAILGELNANDYFNLVKFHSNVEVLDDKFQWGNMEFPKESLLPQAFPATKENIAKVQEVVDKMEDEGLTNIIDALIVGLRLTSKGIPDTEKSNELHKHQPIVVFLTDGQANVGESHSPNMIEIVKARNDHKAAIFTLSFGDDANKEFLKELALKNSGFLKTIYVASDASLQLQDFYKLISSPLLTDVHFKYTDENVQDVTKRDFNILFKGSEIVVAGRLIKPSTEFVTVEGSTLDGHHKYIPHIIDILPVPEKKREYGNLERLWAYLTIKQLLDKKYIASESDTNNTLTPEKEALTLALKYSFVTPITSLVVVKPNKTDSLAEENSRPSYEYDDIVAGQPLSIGGRTNSGGGYYSRTSFKHRPIMKISPPIQPSQALSFNMMSRPAPAGPPTYFPPNRIYGGGGFAGAPTFPAHYHPTTTPRHYLASTTVKSFEIDELPWLTPLLSHTGEITLDNKSYLIKGMPTVDQTPCRVDSLNITGNCTMLKQCSQVYPQLVSLEKYKEYFCTLDSERFAGVCCPQSTTKED